MVEKFTPEEQARLSRNRDALVAIVRGDTHPRREDDERTLGVELERMVIDPTTGHVVAYDDAVGIEALFERWARFYEPDEHLIIDGHLFGFVGRIHLTDGRSVGISITLEPGSQVEASVGPSRSIVDLLDGLEAFDEQFRAACEDLGVEWQLVALGVDPVPSDPMTVPLIPKERYRLMDAYLSQRGRYARDMMRLSASTQVSIDCGEHESMIANFRLACALGPLLSFLCDNVSSWRGLAVEDTPTMVRSRIWERMDPDRCGVVPGTFEDGFSAEAYVDWLLGVKPILFTDEGGQTVSCGDATEADICALRDLKPAELAHMLSMVFPSVRLKGFLEIRDADSMPPRLACALAAFIKGIFYSDTAFQTAYRLFVMDRTDAEVAEAYHRLREKGWEATIYGMPVVTAVDRLVQLAENGLTDPAERTIFHGLSDLWRSHKVPRDLYDSDNLGRF